MKRATRGVAAAWLAVTLSAPSVAASTPAISGIDDPAYETREAITRRLMADDTLDLERVAELYRQATNDEQRVRLLHVARHLAVEQMAVELIPDENAPQPAALGVAHAYVAPGSMSGLEAPTVEVMQTIPGFPAHEHLQQGDLILSFNGLNVPPLSENTGFPSLIQAHPAGQRVTLEVLRNNLTLLITLDLGSARVLRELYSGEELMLREPYRSTWLSVRRQIVRGETP